MVKFSSPLAGLFVIAMTLTPIAVRADPIPITAGIFTILPAEVPFRDHLHLEGPRGFTLHNLGMVSPFGWHEVDFCGGNSPGPCDPGNRISLNEGASGFDLAALVTLDGHTFRTSGGSETEGIAAVQFTGSFLVPSFTGVEAVSILSPFSFLGSVVPPGGGGPGVQLVGAGTARVDLAWVTGREDQGIGPGWDLQRSTYEFQQPDVVPEPASLLLIGTGLVGCLMRRHRRVRG